VNAKPHDGMVWAIDPLGVSRNSEELALPFAVINEGSNEGFGML
jgi:hypothetical protein